MDIGDIYEKTWVICCDSSQFVRDAKTCSLTSTVIEAERLDQEDAARAILQLKAHQPDTYAIRVDANGNPTGRRLDAKGECPSGPFEITISTIDATDKFTF